MLLAMDIVKGPYVHCAAPADWTLHDGVSRNAGRKHTTTTPTTTTATDPSVASYGVYGANDRASASASSSGQQHHRHKSPHSPLSGAGGSGGEEEAASAAAAGDGESVDRLSGLSDVFVPRPEFCRRVLWLHPAESGRLYLYYPEEIPGEHYQRKTLRYSLCIVFRVDERLLTIGEGLTRRLVQPYSVVLANIVEELRDAEIKYRYMSRGLAEQQQQQQQYSNNNSHNSTRSSSRGQRSSQQTPHDDDAAAAAAGRTAARPPRSSGTFPPVLPPHSIRVPDQMRGLSPPRHRSSGSKDGGEEDGSTPLTSASVAAGGGEGAAQRGPDSSSSGGPPRTTPLTTTASSFRTSGDWVITPPTAASCASPPSAASAAAAAAGAAGAAGGGRVLNSFVTPPTGQRWTPLPALVAALFRCLKRVQDEEDESATARVQPTTTTTTTAAAPQPLPRHRGGEKAPSVHDTPPGEGTIESCRETTRMTTAARLSESPMSPISLLHPKGNAAGRHWERPPQQSARPPRLTRGDAPPPATAASTEARAGATTTHTPTTEELKSTLAALVPLEPNEQNYTPATEGAAATTWLSRTARTETELHLGCGGSIRCGGGLHHPPGRMPHSSGNNNNNTSNSTGGGGCGGGCAGPCERKTTSSAGVTAPSSLRPSPNTRGKGPLGAHSDPAAAAETDTAVGGGADVVGGTGAVVYSKAALMQCGLSAGSAELLLKEQLSDLEDILADDTNEDSDCDDDGDDNTRSKRGPSFSSTTTTSAATVDGGQRSLRALRSLLTTPVDTAVVHISDKISFHVRPMPPLPPVERVHLHQVPIPIVTYESRTFEWVDLGVRRVFQLVNGQRTVADIIFSIAAGTSATLLDVFTAVTGAAADGVADGEAASIHSGPDETAAARQQHGIGTGGVGGGGGNSSSSGTRRCSATPPPATVASSSLAGAASPTVVVHLASSLTSHTIGGGGGPLPSTPTPLRHDYAPVSAPGPGGQLRYASLNSPPHTHTHTGGHFSSAGRAGGRGSVDIAGEHTLLGGHHTHHHRVGRTSAASAVSSPATTTGATTPLVGAAQRPSMNIHVSILPPAGPATALDDGDVWTHGPPATTAPQRAFAAAGGRQHPTMTSTTTTTTTTGRNANANANTTTTTTARGTSDTASAGLRRRILVHLPPCWAAASNVVIEALLHLKTLNAVKLVNPWDPHTTVYTTTEAFYAILRDPHHPARRELGLYMLRVSALEAADFPLDCDGAGRQRRRRRRAATVKRKKKPSKTEQQAAAQSPPEGAPVRGGDRAAPPGPPPAGTGAKRKSAAAALSSKPPMAAVTFRRPPASAPLHPSAAPRPQSGLYPPPLRLTPAADTVRGRSSGPSDAVTTAATAAAAAAAASSSWSAAAQSPLQLGTPTGAVAVTTSSSSRRSGRSVTAFRSPGASLPSHAGASLLHSLACSGPQGNWTLTLTASGAGTPKAAAARAATGAAVSHTVPHRAADDGAEAWRGAGAAFIGSPPDSRTASTTGSAHSAHAIAAAAHAAPRQLPRNDSGGHESAPPYFSTFSVTESSSSSSSSSDSDGAVIRRAGRSPGEYRRTSSSSSSSSSSSFSSSASSATSSVPAAGGVPNTTDATVGCSDGGDAEMAQFMQGIYRERAAADVNMAAAAALCALGKLTCSTVAAVQAEMRLVPAWANAFNGWSLTCCKALVESAVLNGWVREVGDHE